MFFNKDMSNIRGYSGHPQNSILKQHIERSVHDIFFAALKEQADELIYLFENEDQIDLFIERTISYWEDAEEYEKCSEVLDLSKKFKRKWRVNQESFSYDRMNSIREWLKNSI